MRALGKLARFQPFIAGADFSFVDCAAYSHLPVVSSASRAVVAADTLVAVAGISDSIKFIAPGPHAQRVNVERKSFAASRGRA